jgi:prophage antirepressor-like protein
MTTIFETLHENHIIFENHTINIIIDSNDVVWFKAHDLTKALGYNKQNDTIQLHIDKDDKIQLQNINHNYNNQVY